MAAILLPTSEGRAQNLSIDVRQYGHSAWTLRDGALTGSPRAVAQTSDGYLWLGTEFGLIRFDGVRFDRWTARGDKRLADASIVTLLAGRDGSLWVGTIQGLTQWKDGRARRIEALDGLYIAALIEDRTGTVWAGTSGGLTGAGELCAIQSESVTCDGRDGRFGRIVMSLHQDAEGQIWAGSATGLWRWTGVPQRFDMPETPSEIHAIASGDTGLLVALSREIRQVSAGTSRTLVLDGDPRVLKPTALLRDRIGHLWIGTQDQGLVHVHDGRTDRYRRGDGLSSDFVTDLLEDREGNVWVATANGLDRFRRAPVAVVSTPEGLSSDSVTSVLADPAGGIWLGTVNGLNRWNRGRASRHATHPSSSSEVVGSMLQDRRGRLWVTSPRGIVITEAGRTRSLAAISGGYVHAMVEDSAGDMWLSDQSQGLLRVRDATVERIPWQHVGGRVARALAADPSGGIWLGFFAGGVSHFKDGAVSGSFGQADGLGGGAVKALYRDGAGALWAATEHGLSRIQGGQVQTLTVAHGLPCDAVQWVLEDHERTLWLHTACGLVRIRANDIDAWTRNPQARVQATVYDESDGVLSYRDIGSYAPKATVSRDGRLWFVVPGGVAVIDPRRIPFNALPPPVHLERVEADGVTYDPTGSVELPPLVRDLRFDYTALSLSLPAKVRFRYRLEGRDEGWVDVGNRRQAFYSDLAPQRYRFRVVAANEDGVWNETGASWEFVIPPALHQTNGFKASLVIVSSGLLWLLYWVRLRRLRAHLQAHFETRLAERTRIAQELHDTLLQGWVSASMQLYLVRDEMGDHPARPRLERILKRVTQVIDDGRNAVEGLRTDSSAEALDHVLARDAEYYRGDRAIDICVRVNGTREPIRPVIRDEVYRITREAVVNAFSHAEPKRVDIEVNYLSSSLSVRIRDDGKGIEPNVSAHGRPGHWGMTGMRERATQIGATLQIWSGVNRGTEVHVEVPRRLAFERQKSDASAWRRHVRALIGRTS